MDKNVYIKDEQGKPHNEVEVAVRKQDTIEIYEPTEPEERQKQYYYETSMLNLL